MGQSRTQELSCFAFEMVFEAANRDVLTVDDEIRCARIAIIRETDAACIRYSETLEPPYERTMNVAVDYDFGAESSICALQVNVPRVGQGSPPKIAGARMNKADRSLRVQRG